MICYIIKKKDSIAPEEPWYWNKHTFWVESLHEATLYKSLSDAEDSADLNNGETIAKVEIKEVSND